MGGHNVTAVPLNAIGDHGLETGQCVTCQPGAVTGLHFDVAAKLQEKGEHADRLEIDFLAAKHRHPGAGNIGQANCRGHRHVHGQVAAANIPERVSEERASAIEHNGGGDQKAEPAEKTDKLWRQVIHQLEIQRKGQHHALERAYARDGKADQRGAMFGF